MEDTEEPPLQPSKQGAELTAVTTVCHLFPNAHSTPINEYSGFKLAINAFPSLFPNSEADFNEEHNIKVSMKEWASHLLCFNSMSFILICQ